MRVSRWSERARCGWDEAPAGPSDSPKSRRCSSYAIDTFTRWSMEDVTTAGGFHQRHADYWLLVSFPSPNPFERFHHNVLKGYRADANERTHSPNRKGRPQTPPSFLFKAGRSTTGFITLGKDWINGTTWRASSYRMKSTHVSYSATGTTGELRRPACGEVFGTTTSRDLRRDYISDECVLKGVGRWLACGEMGGMATKCRGGVVREWTVFEAHQ